MPFEWNFNYEGALAGLSDALDERAKSLTGESLDNFNTARPVIIERATDKASDGARHASQGHIEGDNLIKNKRTAPEGLAVRIHSFENAGEFQLNVKSYDSPADS